jgi:glycosyltransferase involved in cell wall biosynthesis
MAPANMQHRIGFISTRFAGTDGVSLESAKWAEILWRDKHTSYWYGGRLDRASDVSMCVPEAHFTHPANRWINERVIGRSRRSRAVTNHIRDLADFLKDTLYRFLEKFQIDVIVPQNCLTIPMHIPLGIALTELIAETGIAAIAHHHDFYWERTRFQATAADDYLEMAFPPRLPSIQHVVINQAAREELSWRCGIPSTLIPNIIDFESPAPQVDEYSADLREQIGLREDDVIILQPTRLVPRKGIEHAIQLLEMLGDSRYKLVVSHEAGDEGYDYLHMLRDLAHESGVDMRVISDRVSDVRRVDVDGRKLYTLWDIYPYASLVTFPSIYEGFGNALLEAIYFQVPILINRYSIYARDIEPRGFRMPTINGFITRKTVEEVRRLLEDGVYRKRITDHNYKLARKFFSYSVAYSKLKVLIANAHGD